MYPRRVGKWTTDDIAAVYNMAMVMDDKSISEFVETHQLLTNPIILNVRVIFFADVANISSYSRLVKLPLLVAQYMCDKNRYEPAGPQKFMAHFIKSRLDILRSDD